MEARRKKLIEKKKTIRWKPSLKNNLLPQDDQPPVNWNWNTGKLVTLNLKDSASCQLMNPQRLYAVFIYNTSQNASAVTAEVTANFPPAAPGQNPVSLTKPVIVNAGPASICFVCGIESVSINISSVGDSLSPTNMAIADVQPQIQTFIGGVSMPLASDDIESDPLPVNGYLLSFPQCQRYYADLSSTVFKAYEGMVGNSQQQSVFVHFHYIHADVIIVNNDTKPFKPVIEYINIPGTSKKNKNSAATPETPSNNDHTTGAGEDSSVTILSMGSYNHRFKFEDDDSMHVWISADSDQSGQSAYIQLKGL